MGCHDFLQGNPPKSRTEPASLMSPAWAGRVFSTSATWKASQKELKVIKTGMEEGKIYIFADDMILHIQPQRHRQKFFRVNK